MCSLRAKGVPAPEAVFFRDEARSATALTAHGAKDSARHLGRA